MIKYLELGLCGRIDLRSMQLTKMASLFLSHETICRCQQIQLLGGHGFTPICGTMMLSYVLVEAAVHCDITREAFLWADCGGARSQCERYCGCVSREMTICSEAFAQEIRRFEAALHCADYYAAVNSFVRTSPRMHHRALADPHSVTIPSTPRDVPVSSRVLTEDSFERVMPVGAKQALALGRLGSNTAMITSKMPDSIALCDNGATADCMCSDLGRLPGTFNASRAGDLSVGDSGSVLRSEGSWLHAVTRVADDGTEQDIVFEALHTPNGIANIFSEALEVRSRKSTIIWEPGQSRTFSTTNGKQMPLHITPNGLGWLYIKATTPDRVMVVLSGGSEDPYVQSVLKAVMAISKPITERILKQDPIPACEFAAALSTTASSSTREVTLSHAISRGVKGLTHQEVMRALYLHHNAPADERAMPVIATGAMAYDGSIDLRFAMLTPDTLADVICGVHTGVGMRRPPKLTDIELLRRTHVVLGHTQLDNIVATLKRAYGTDFKLSSSAIEQYIREGCGVCDTAKMRRRAIGLPLTDHTPLPIGKKWIFDSIKLRVAAALDKSIYITRFVNRISGGNGKRRSYGHKLLDSASIEVLIQKLRAMVRPIHGEILVLRRDGLPAQQSYSIEEFLSDSLIHGETSPPYVHEGVGDCEVTWQWDVPSANALLRGCLSDESHFLTAFYDVERSGNMLSQSGKPSRDDVFYGNTQYIMQWGLVYGSPVKFLVHPEKRDSKFNDHAEPGIYRGPSRVDESLYRCLVQQGVGATMRHTTVDIGCMRIDERSVLHRSDRNHPDHQPHAIDASQPSPAADFTAWHNPVLQSQDEIGLWTASSPLPTRTTMVFLGAGSRREGDALTWARKLSGATRDVVIIDRSVGGYEHDWTMPNVNSALVRLCSCPLVESVFWSADCGGFSALRCMENGGPLPLFDSVHPHGIPNSSGVVPAATLAICESIDHLLVILRAAAIRCKRMMGESTPTRGTGSPVAFKETIYSKHISPWEYPPLAKFLSEFGFTTVYADQGAAGATTMKTTEFKASPLLLPHARVELGTLVDKRKERNTPDTTLIGGDSGDYSRSRASAQYPSELWRRIVKVMLGDTAISDTVEPPAQRNDVPTDLPASLLRPHRAATSARYDRHGNLITAIFDGTQTLPTSDLDDPYASIALTRNCL